MDLAIYCRRYQMTNCLFEYAIIRFVPKVEREEFINVGVILFCKDQNYLEIKYALPTERIKAIAPQVEEKEIAQHLEAFAKICAGQAEGGPIGELSAAERFRWLSATRSTMVQCSKVHPGLSTNLALTLERLFAEMVV
jgi:hypothetical protein